MTIISPGQRVLQLDETGSTNREAHLLIQQGLDPRGMVISARYQTSGRGQRGAVWESAYGKNLLISYIIHPTALRAEDLFLLNQALGLAVRDFLSSLVPDLISIKWPNDIMAGNRKIAGLLIENTLRGSECQHTVAGIGINVNQTKFQYYTPKATSLALLTEKELDLDICLSQMTESLNQWYLRLEKRQVEDIRESYLSNLFRKGIPARYESAGESFEGTIMGVLPGGELMIADTDGRIRVFGNKEVKYLY